MKALEFERNIARFAAANAISRLSPGKGATVGPLALRDIDPPGFPTDEWVRLRPRLAGICGSDLATIDGRSSRYFEPIVSFPFVPGHEVVGNLDDDSRAVLVPVLSCATRGIDPPCDWCARGCINRCERVAFGHLTPGLQSGFCTDTGGGWSTQMVAHPSQLIAVPDDLSDEAAVLVEPTACAVHAALQTHDDFVAVIGSGTLGLLTIAALRHGEHPPKGTLLATARYHDQQILAKELGADVVIEPSEVGRRVRSITGSLALGDQLTCGFETVIDCVGSADSIAHALQIVAPGGMIVLVGMPGHTALDLTGLWHREVTIKGCYAYQHEDFATAIDLVRSAELERLVSATYPLAEFRRAIEHAANAGRRGAVKVAFDLRREKERNR
ncbi:MAG: zinc-binding dehydrogenase [Acidimicrobiales bacterium]